MKKAILLIFVLAFVLGTAGMAEASCDGKRCTGKIKRLVVTTSQVKIETDQTDQSDLNCTLNNDVYITLEQSHPLFREIYSLAVTALASKSPMTLRIVEGSSNCAISYVVGY